MPEPDTDDFCPVLHRRAAPGRQKSDRLASTGERHLRDDEPIVGPRLERHPLARAIQDDFLEQLEPRLFLVDDARGLHVEVPSLLLIERITSLLHDLVEARAGLAARPE